MPFLFRKLQRDHRFLKRRDLHEMKTLPASSSLGFLMPSTLRTVCIQAIATLPLPPRSRMLVAVAQKVDLKPYQKALQDVLPGKAIMTSTDLRERGGHSQQADILIGTVHQSLTWLLQQRINPERVIIVAPEKAINAYQQVQRNVISRYEALFLRLNMRQKYWRQVMLISQEPLLMLRSHDIGLIQEYFEHPEAEFNYDVNDELLPLSDDDLDGLLLTLLWWKHWTPTKIYRLLQGGASQGGLLLKQAPSRERIIERLKYLQGQFESSLVLQARSPATHWTTTFRGRAFLAWGFVSTQTQALEGILQEEESSASQLLQLFRTLLGPRKNPAPLQKLLEWVNTHPADEPLPGSLTKGIRQLGYPIRYLTRFYAHRLNVRSHQLLQRLTMVLQKTTPDGQEAPRATEPEQRAISKTDRKLSSQISFKDVLKLVNRVRSPVSVSMVAEHLACPRWVARYWLEKLSTCQKAS
ncbi:MAG: hypothetical protein ACE5OZ_20000, partial [Candidatus Heimdallarchaeota archaeon]